MGRDALIEQYLCKLLKGFEEDPADSEYQNGYKAAIEELLETITNDKLVLDI